MSETKEEKHVHIDPTAKDAEETKVTKGRVKNVLIAVDGSAASNRGLDWYLEEMHHEGNCVTLMHCFELPLMYSYQEMYVAPDLWQATLKKEADRTAHMEKIFMKKLKLKEIKGNFIARGGGKPGEAILSAADEYDIDMIVVGTRGHGKLMRALLGSVSHFVMSHAHCPVLVYRDKAAETEKHRSKKEKKETMETKEEHKKEEKTD